MFKITIMVGMLALASCAKDVTPKHIKKAEKICKSKGGINHFDTRDRLTVVCNFRSGRKHNFIGDSND